MALNFPNNPINGQVYTDPISGIKYIYNSSIGAWESAVQPSAIVSVTEPTTVVKGKIWFNPSNKAIQVWDSTQWVKPVTSTGAMVSDTPPTLRNDGSALLNGDLWWNSDDGNMYLYYVDVDSSQWVVCIPIPNITQFAGGSAADPGLSIIGDDTTGIFSVASGSVSFALLGVSKFTIADSGVSTPLTITSTDDITGLTMRAGTGSASDVAFGSSNGSGMYASNTNEVSFATASTQRVVIDSAGDASFLSTGATKISTGTSAQRPTGANGKIRFNTTLGKYEGFNSTTASWMSLGGSGVTVGASAPVSPPPIDGDMWFNNTVGTGGLFVYFSTTWVRITYNTSLLNSVGILDNISSSFNGVTTTFNLRLASNPIALSSGYEVIVSLDGVFQENGYAFNIDINNSQIIFTEAPETGVRCQLLYIAQIVQIGTPSDNTVTTPKLVNLSVTSGKVAAKAILNSKLGWDGLSFDDRNFIMNGDMSVWTRGTSITAPAGATTYGPDRWFIAHAGSSSVMSKQQFFGPIGASSFWPATSYNNGSFTRITATSVAGSGNYSVFGQAFLGMEALVNGSVTVSFWAKCDGNKTVGVELCQYWNGSNGTSDVGFVTPQTVALTTTWQKFTLTFTMPNIGSFTYGSYNTRGNEPQCRLHFWLDAGSTFSSRSGGVPQQNITFDVTGIQLEAGDTASPFTLTPPNIEEIRCAYFYQRNNSGFHHAWISNQQQGSSDWTAGGGYNTASTSTLMRFFVNNMWAYPFRTATSSTNTSSMVCRTSSGTPVDYFRFYFLHPGLGYSRTLSFTYRWRTLDDPYTPQQTNYGVSMFSGVATLGTGGNPGSFGTIQTSDVFPNSVFGMNGILLLHCDASWNQIATAYAEINAELI